MYPHKKIDVNLVGMHFEIQIGNRFFDLTPEQASDLVSQLSEFSNETSHTLDYDGRPLRFDYSEIDQINNRYDGMFLSESGKQEQLIEALCDQNARHYGLSITDGVREQIAAHCDCDESVDLLPDSIY